MTIPSAPCLSCLTIRITVWAKRGSPIVGAAIKSCPVSDAVSAGSAAGENSRAARIAAAGSERRVEICADGMRFLVRRAEQLTSLVAGSKGDAKIRSPQQGGRAHAKSVLEHHNGCRDRREGVRRR